jgi:hypothetical protein
MTAGSNESLPDKVAGDVDAFQDSTTVDPIFSPQMLCIISEQSQSNDDGATGSEEQSSTGLYYTNTSHCSPLDFLNYNESGIEPEPEPWPGAAPVNNSSLVNGKEVRAFQQRKGSMSTNILAKADTSNIFFNNSLDHLYNNKDVSAFRNFDFEDDGLPNSGIKNLCNDAATLSTSGATTHDSAHRSAKRQKRIPGAYVCPTRDCFAAYDTACELRKHDQRKHLPEAMYPFGCSYCSRRFFDRRDLNRHNISQHS